MRLPALLLACVLMVPAAFAAAPQAGARPDHVADRDCLACHPDQADAWAESKHRHAMQPATAQTVLGDFGEAGSGEVRFGEGAAAARFYRRGGDFMVAAQGPDGRTQALAASHVFGIRPLQQVLLPQQGGRLQAFTIAWDTTRKTWFSLHADGPVAPGDNLHWSGRYQNWNLMCGECHTTAYRKGYDDEHDRYATTWAEANVGCQACHGAGRAHTESARKLAAAGEHGQTPLPTPNRALAGAHAQVDQCATCHARRTRLVEDAVAGAPLFDQFIPDNLRPGLYHADGQQLDEVFEYGSYRQSRMYQAGVACTDCHDPHRGRLRAEGNALCTACHNPAPDRGRFPGLQAKDYDAPSHHFHRGGGAGSQCVDCHMPSRNYMVVHPRRDHAIRVPRPDLGARTGAPDACTGC
ncbi:multiheme c-type cytochrome, partial [Thauera aminoaromatica]|uniref:multiheme c-type cytochrome n=1 Tax=Thauera aminoaromatica TaxID=164330 RepID=UPI0035B38735